MRHHLSRRIVSLVVTFDSRPNPTANRFAWAAYAASALALLYALVSFYWAVGGTRGIGTLGQSLERLARSRTAAAAAVISIVIVCKLAGALLALAFVRPWGRRLNHRLLLAIGYLASAILFGYGLIEVSGEALVETGIVRPTPSVDWRALRWHLILWDMWFLVWGALLGLAVWGYQSSRAVRGRSRRQVR